MKIKNNLAKIFFLAFVIVTFENAFSHGEDKPGPHGGSIQMPGPFHTEILQPSKTGFTVYLLDLNWKNPTVKNSKVVVSLQQNKNIIASKCESKSDFFSCDFPNTINIATGKLILRAERDGQKGIPAEYELPLKFNNPEKKSDNHKH